MAIYGRGEAAEWPTGSRKPGLPVAIFDGNRRATISRDPCCRSRAKQCRCLLSSPTSPPGQRSAACCKNRRRPDKLVRLRKVRSRSKRHEHGAERSINGKHS